VSRHESRIVALALALSAGVALAVAGCGGGGGGGGGGSSKHTTTSGGSGGGRSGGTISMVASTYPQSLDPGFDYSGQGFEVNSVVYTGLLTYHRANGTAGTKLMPGLATTLPTITDGGRTYTMTLRKGLVFSDGKPVLASDFTYAFERAVKIPWGGSGQFMTPRVVGAAAYAAGKAKTISGIVTNDRTGKVVIHLTHPYGAFENVLALPALGLVPAGTPMHNEANNPPPGVGPYMVRHVVVNQSYTLARNPYWSRMHIPGIPAGHADSIVVKVNADIASNAESVLNNSTDVFDYNDTVPGSLLPQIRAKAADRFKEVPLGISTWYVFMNVREKPFSSFLAREAVAVGLNRSAMNRIASGTLQPGCFLLPPAVPGHPSGACPYGSSQTGNLARAKQLVKRSGMAGTPVTVWAQSGAPTQPWMTYYTQFLSEIGFKATIKVIAASVYAQTIGELRLHPQTGEYEWIEDFPNPMDYYGVLLDGGAILKTNNLNFGEVNDPHVNAEVARLGVIPPTRLSSTIPRWRALDEYVARKAYVVPYGYPVFPEFVSDRLDVGALVLNPVYGWDFTSFELK
jgi:peptide/nickel transport system substrate-binding protein